MSSSPGTTSPKSQAKKWITFVLRWGIAIAGIWYVLSNISLHDRVHILGPDDLPVEVKVVGTFPEKFNRSTQIQVIDPHGNAITISRDKFVNKPDTSDVMLREGRQQVHLRGLDLTDDREARVLRLLIEKTPGKGAWVLPDEVIDYRLQVPHPIVDRGLVPMVRNANRAYLWGAVLVFPTVYVITALRWHLLLRALSIHITRARAFVLNMVGAFYNTFMPGSTGGDVLKAWYIAKQTSLRTRGVMSVIVDRGLGLLTLILMGGVMATIQFFRLPPDDPARTWCGRVSLGSLLIFIATGAGLIVFYSATLRRLTGLDFLLRRLPMQTQVKKAVEALEIYRSKPLLILWTIIMTLPVHATTVVSATLAGKAFGLPLHPLYYWVVVPVVVLVGSIPISPQGAGVMEFFAILLTRRQGATVSQAFALTMSIRLVQIFWNLMGGIFVLRGGYHAPTEKEQQDLETDAAADSQEPEKETADARR